MEASQWLGELMERDGLEVLYDPAGNVIGKLGDSASPAVVIGSHLDTVPEGGTFDGALGVMAGLCSARILAASNAPLDHPLWVVAFMDEEGVRFGSSFFGSLAFAGHPLPSLERLDRHGTSLREAIAATGRDPGAVGSAKGIHDVLAYLELHVEQGPTLAERGVPLGIVTGVVGRRTFRVRVNGMANHAGTTPRSHRRDALRGGALVVARVHAAFDQMHEGTVNVGAVKAEPGAVNVIPGKAELDVEIRASTQELLDRAELTLRGVADPVARELGLGIEVEVDEQVDPILFDERLIELLESVAAAEGVESMRLPSGAGHDAMIMAGHVPAGMLMVPSREGISHSPDEFTEASDCQLGARVLAAAARELTTNGLEGR
jgi:hydantoinase/carbamoylase family amidase